MPISFDKYAADTHILDANRAYAKKVAELTLEVGRLREEGSILREMLYEWVTPAELAEVLDE